MIIVICDDCGAQNSAGEPNVKGEMESIPERMIDPNISHVPRYGKDLCSRCLWLRRDEEMMYMRVGHREKNIPRIGVK